MSIAFVSPDAGQSDRVVPSAIYGVVAIERAEDRATSSDATVLAARIALQRRVAQFADGNDITARIRAASAQARSLGRDVEIEALLRRLFEVDPRSAAELTAALALPHSLLEAVFRGWAELDTPSAIELLARVGGAAHEMLLALAILDVGDYAEDLYERLIAESRTLDTAWLDLAAIVQRARRDPLGAVSDVQQLSGYDAREVALEEIARASVRLHPAAALAAAELVTDWFLGHEYQVALLEEWAGTDMPALLEHLGSLDPRDPWAANLAQLALDAAPIEDPLLALASADELGGELGQVLRSAALEGLAEEDPAAALAYVESHAAGRNADALLGAVARSFARSDIDAALAWAQSLDPPSTAAVSAVTAELASVDLLRAVDFDLKHGSSRAPPAWMILRTRSDLSDPARIADRIVAAEDSARRTNLLRPLMERWVETDPYGALAWMQTHEGEASTLMRTLASRLGERSLNQALDLTTLVSQRFRPEWVQQAVRANAAYDPAGTLATLERVRDQPYYGEAVGNVVLSTASRYGPVAAAVLLDRASPAAVEAAAVSVAMQWANLDAPAAADWAATLRDREIRFDSIRAVLQDWITRDVAAASRWTFGLADEALRERVLAYICGRAPEASHCGA